MTQNIVQVELGARRYDIVVGANALQELVPRFVALSSRPRAIVVTDDQVAALHLDTVASALTSGGIASEAIVLPAGEETKSFRNLETLLEGLIDKGVERGDAIIALGGGVIGDLTGLAAALLRRGTPFVQIPTTLLAQVDSSVGGKTAINVPQGKNLVGAFHQPAFVIVDTAFLKTLPLRERLAGYAEIVKYGVLGDAAFFAWLEENGGHILAGDDDALTQAITTSCLAKATIVAADERETGERALLNLGHTFGHALEAATGFSGRLLHGEGVAIGMGLALDLSANLGHTSPQDAARLRAHLRHVGAPSAIADIPGGPLSVDQILAPMAQDKKVKNGTLTFILARGIGEAFVESDVNPDAVRHVLTAAISSTSET